MFRDNPKPKPPRYQARPVPKLAGTDVPGAFANQFGHIARDPNTQYDLKLFFFHQRQEEDDSNAIAALKNRIKEEKLEAKYIKHHENKRFKRKLNDKVEAKMQDYESRIDVRRKKLTDIMYEEEREYTREVIEKTQKDYARRLEEKEEVLKKIHERKEMEREKIVQEKRLQQYLDRCVEYRPLVAVQRYKDAAEVQKIQMKENESKRMSEKELEHFWHLMTQKYCAEIDEREEQDRLFHLKYQRECNALNDILLKEKIGEQQQRKRDREQEKEELDKLIKDFEDEEREFAERQLRKKKNLFETCQNQIKEHQERLQREAEDEKKIQEAYDILTVEEVRKYNETTAAKGSEAAKVKAEMTKKYKAFAEQMKREQEELERNIDAVIKADLEEMQRKEDANRCADIKAKEALQKSVLEIRAQQIVEKKQHDEEMRRKAELEANLRMESEKYYAEKKREYNRLKVVHQKQYQNDLKEQMAYSKVLAEREELNNKKILESAKVEENLYNSIVKKVLSGEAKISETHPFKLQYDNQKCHCLKPNY